MQAEERVMRALLSTEWRPTFCIELYRKDAPGRMEGIHHRTATSQPTQRGITLNRKRILIVVVLLGAVAVGLGFFWPFRQRGPSLQLPGVVEIQEIHLGSKIGGRVADVLVKEQDLVEPRQVL